MAEQRPSTAAAFAPENASRAVGPAKAADGGPPIRSGIAAKIGAEGVRRPRRGIECSGVRRIEAVVVEQHVSAGHLGEMREALAEPTALEIPNLVVTLADAHAGDFEAWFEDFVVRGNNGEDGEKEGKIEFLDATMKAALLT